MATPAASISAGPTVPDSASFVTLNVTPDPVFIRLDDPNGDTLSLDLTAEASGTPQFATPAIFGGGDTYHLTISADSLDATSRKAKTDDYTALVHGKATSSPPSSTPDLLRTYTDITVSTHLAADVVQAALKYVGARWHTGNCTGVVWAVPQSIGAPFK